VATHQDADVGGRDAKLTCDLGDGQERLLGHAGTATCEKVMAKVGRDASILALLCLLARLGSLVSSLPRPAQRD
jgi:hypothetical protein